MQRPTKRSDDAQAAQPSTTSSSRKRRIAAAASVSGLLGAGIGAGVVAVAPEPASATPGQAYGNYYWFSFNAADPENSTLWALSNGSFQASWRSGAGNGASTNPCQTNAGPLPPGFYGTQGAHFDRNKNGNSIDGRSIHVDNKACHNGTTRTELFLHSEETVSNGQSCGAGDQPHCWETWKDYRSLGCIKLAHPNNGFSNDIGAAASWIDGKGGWGGSEHVQYDRILYVAYW